MNFPLHLQTFAFSGQSVSLFVPDAEVVKKAYQNSRISFPYWSKVWPAAVGLTAFLMQHPQYVQGKRVVEAGAGLGLPSMAAAQTAASVLCTDVVPEAVEIVRQSAAQAGLQNLEAAVLDWAALLPNADADVLLLSDVNYEPAAFAELQKTIERFLQTGAAVIVATPQRLMAKAFILPLLRYCTQQDEMEAEENGTTVPVTVLVLKN